MIMQERERVLSKERSELRKQEEALSKSKKEVEKQLAAKGKVIPPGSASQREAELQSEVDKCMVRPYLYVSVRSTNSDTVCRVF
jgi:E3 ubiquitin-protein ligase BRE1